MLDSITIKNFKAIGDPGLTLSGLSSVNYLVGKNGCGKSSVLEAIECIEMTKNEEINKNIDTRIIKPETCILVLIEDLPFETETDITKYANLKLFFDQLGENKSIVFEVLDNVINRMKQKNLNLINKNCKTYLPYRVCGNAGENKTVLTETGGNNDIFSQRWDMVSNSFNISLLENYLKVVIDELSENHSIDITTFINTIKKQLKSYLNQYFHDYSQPFDYSENKTTTFISNSVKIFNYNNLGLNFVDKNSQLDKTNRDIILKLLIDIGNFTPPDNNLIYGDSTILIFGDEANTSISVNTLSSGQKIIIKLFYILKSHVNKATIVLFDEPENSFHPEVQKKLPALFASFPNVQFFVATHSPFIISAAAGLPGQKVYLIEDGQTVDIYGKKSSGKSKVGYEDGNFILAANKMLGAGLSDLIPTKLIFCEASLAEFIKSFCKHNKITIPSFVTGGGDTNTIDRGQVWKSIYSSLNQYNMDKILDINIHIIIDNNPQVKDKIQLFEAEHPNELCILKADEQEKLFWDIKKEKFIEFLQSVNLPQWNYTDNDQATFDKFLRLNNQISNKGKLKCDLGEHMGKQFTPDDFKQFSPELHNIIFNQNP